uniref:Cilia- and flagella-associated protein 263 n=2 Tax=Pogona vitticeps TaxID=103695 RepID=A0ABM5EU21_9SAUR
MADEESERDSIHTGESRDPGEELQQDLAELSLAQLAALVEETSYANSILQLETEMFEKFFRQIEPKDLVPEKHGSSLDLGQVAYIRGRRKSKSRMTTDRLICLTVEQKCDIAQRELEETKEDTQRMKERSEKILQNYLAVLEEADIRIADIKRAMVDFDKGIVKTITKKKGSVIASDKVLRYMEDRIRSRDALKEKIRLKNDSLKVQRKKLQLQLKQKEELGEALHEVDFQQLKIENAQFVEKIDERNQELLQLKLTVGSTLQVLNFYKKKLQSATALASQLVKDMAQRKESLEKIEHEAILVGEERDTAEVLNKKLRKQLAEYRVPPILDYVREKMQVQELRNTIRIWERKVEIAEMALQSYRSVWHKAKMASHQLQALLPPQGAH